MRDFIPIFEFAYQKHDGQLDKAGQPYILHPITVALGCKEESEKVVAYLHDVLEDTDATVDDLINLGLLQEEIDAIVLLTKPKGEEYSAYIERVSKNRLATVVKMSDLRHNMQIDRIPNPSEKDFKRIKKYRKAYEFLRASLRKFEEK